MGHVRPLSVNCSSHFNVISFCWFGINQNTNNYLFLRITIFIYTPLFKTQSYNVFEKDKIKSTCKVYTILKSCKRNNILI